PALAHLLTCIFPLPTLSPILLLLGPVGQVLNFLSMPVMLIFLVAGFLLALGTNHPSSAPPLQHHPAPGPHRAPVAPVGQGTPYGTGAPLPLVLEAHSRTIGVPGQGLHESGFSEDNVSLGVKGEIATAEILARLVRDYPSAVVGHSMRVNPGTEADLDHVFVIGNRMIVVDSKMWKSRRTYALGAHMNKDDDDVVEVWDGSRLDEFRNTAMPWMLREVADQFPGYIVSGLICIHGVSETASASQSITESAGGKRSPNLDLILARDLGRHLEAIAADTQFSPTDSAVISHLMRLKK